MTQPAFDFSLPIAGRHPRARHASASGAARAATDRGALSVAMLQLLRAVGPRGLSDYEMAAALGRPVSSMNSTRAGLGGLVVPSGSYEISPWGTKRTRWRLA